MSAESKLHLISDQSREEINQWLVKYPEDKKRSAVIAALRILQEQNNGGLDTDIMDAVAELLEMPSIQVYEVAKFYSMFHIGESGRHKISICDNISCMLRGGDKIVAHVEEKLGVTRGETTEDGKFTLVREEECLAACCGAPMMVVDGHYYENLTPEKVDEILDGLE
ncbi:MAG: NADH-quinone oxidoreductase subunit NuoE family protein [bacterium]